MLETWFSDVSNYQNPNVGEILKTSAFNLKEGGNEIDDSYITSLYFDQYFFIHLFIRLHNSQEKRQAEISSSLLSVT